jgi:hypothetical protein
MEQPAVIFSPQGQENTLVKGSLAPPQADAAQFATTHKYLPDPPDRDKTGVANPPHSGSGS